MTTSSNKNVQSSTPGVATSSIQSTTSSNKANNVVLYRLQNYLDKSHMDGLQPSEGKFILETIMGLVWNTKYDGMIPIYRLVGNSGNWNGKHMLWTSTSYSNSDTTNIKTYNYTLSQDGASPLFYAYSSQQPGTFPLYVIYNPMTEITNPNPDFITVMGGNPSSPYVGLNNNNPICWILPIQNS